MKTLMHNIRSTGICLITAVAIAAPSVGQAGWFKDSKPVRKVVTRVAATPGKAKEGIEDIAAKVNEIYSQISENRPLLEQMKNSRMIENLKETFVFINEMQADYQVFADQGVYTARLDIKDVLYGFGDITQAFPGAESDGKIMDKVEQAANLVDKMPAQFLYVMDKAVGPQLSELQDKIDNIRDSLAMLPNLPSKRELYRDPMAHVDSLCELENNRAVAVSIAVLQARLKAVAFVIKNIKAYLPDDLTVMASVVAGGGGTVTKHPAQYPLQILLTIVEGIDLKISNFTSIAKSVCTQ